MPEITDEAKKMALDYLNKLNDGLGQGIDFAKEQVPMVAWEIVAYGRAVNTATIVLSLVWIIMLVVIYKKWWKFTNTFVGRGYPDDAPTFTKFVGGFVVGLASIPGFINFCNAFGPCLKSWVAPRLYLIEYIHTLTK